MVPVCSTSPPRDEFTGGKQHQRSPFRCFAHGNLYLHIAAFFLFPAFSDLRTKGLYSYAMQCQHPPPLTLIMHAMVILSHVTSQAANNMLPHPRLALRIHSRNFRP